MEHISVVSNDLKIRKRCSSLIGKPSAIFNLSNSRLSKKQLNLLEKLPNRGYIRICKKDNIKITMKDLSCLTAYTGVEFSLFERNDAYMLFRGSETGISISSDIVSKLKSSKYKWIGHTHPGSDNLCLVASDDDYNTLEKLGQESSTIYNSVGNFNIFYR